VPVYSGERESMVLRAAAVVDAKTEKVTLFKWGDITEPVENKTVSTGACKIVSSEKVSGKLRIVLECE